MAFPISVADKGTSVDFGALRPFSDAGAKHGGAAGGPSMGTDNPSRPVTGGPVSAVPCSPAGGRR
jgi:hypothetical protein